MNVLSDVAGFDGETNTVRIRYRHEEAGALVAPIEDGSARVAALDPGASARQCSAPNRTIDRGGSSSYTSRGGYMDALDVISRRRSIRRSKEDRIPRELLEKLLAVSLLSPSK